MHARTKVKFRLEIYLESSKTDIMETSDCLGVDTLLKLLKNYSRSCKKYKNKEHHDETGCQALEGPILCINNCGFFGIAATMNMCSKCHKDLVLKQEQAKLAALSIGSIVNGSGSTSGKEPVVYVNVDGAIAPMELKTISAEPSDSSVPSESSGSKVKEGPTRCNTCKKRVGLMGFNCRCGNVFCVMHRYSDKHDCQFNYRTAARDAITKANPVIKAEKLDKI